MLKVNVVLDEVPEALDYFLVEFGEADFSFAFLDLFWGQCH